jgi:hypothetical protein
MFVKGEYPRIAVAFTGNPGRRLSRKPGRLPSGGDAECGCGSGHTTKRIAEIHPYGEVGSWMRAAAGHAQLPCRQGAHHDFDAHRVWAASIKGSVCSGIVGDSSSSDRMDRKLVRFVAQWTVHADRELPVVVREMLVPGGSSFREGLNGTRCARWLLQE